MFLSLVCLGIPRLFIPKEQHQYHSGYGVASRQNIAGSAPFVGAMVADSPVFAVGATLTVSLFTIWVLNFLTRSLGWYTYNCLNPTTRAPRSGQRDPPLRPGVTGMRSIQHWRKLRQFAATNKNLC
jgi:hypothetical protein